MKDVLARISLGVTLLFPAIAWSGDGQATSQAMALRGLRSVTVLVAVVGESKGFKAMVSEDALRTKIQVRLREAGLAVLPSEDRDKALSGSAQFGRLSFVVTAVDAGSGGPLYGLHWQLALSQGLWQEIPGKSRQLVTGASWQAASMGVYGAGVVSSEGMVNDADRMMDVFVNDWLAVNGAGR